MRILSNKKRPSDCGAFAKIVLRGASFLECPVPMDPWTNYGDTLLYHRNVVCLAVPRRHRKMISSPDLCDQAIRTPHRVTRLDTERIKEMLRI